MNNHIVPTDILIRQSTIQHPKFVKVLNTMHEIFERKKLFGVQDSMAVFGLPGTGKTSICDAFMAMHERYDEVERTVVPVLRFDAPSATTGIALLKAILLAYGEQDTAGLEPDLFNRTVVLIKACDTQMLVMDEAQQLVERGLKKTHVKMADTLKLIMNATGACVALFGTDRTRELLRVQPALRRRFKKRENLDPWHLNDQDKASEFASVANALLENPAVTQEYAHLLEPGFITRLLFGSDGRIDFLVNLIAEAVRICEAQGKKKLDIKHFHAGFISAIWSETAEADNPFSDKFVARRLNEPNDPFWEVE